MVGSKLGAVIAMVVGAMGLFGGAGEVYSLDASDYPNGCTSADLNIGDINETEFWKCLNPEREQALSDAGQNAREVWCTVTDTCDLYK